MVNVISLREVVEAMEACGNLLATKFPPGSDNPDELPNKVVLL